MDFYEDFKAIDNESAFGQFLGKYGFQKVVPAEQRWNLGQYELRHGGVMFVVGYRWYDPSQAFSVQKDIHKAELWTVDSEGTKVVRGNIEFQED